MNKKNIILGFCMLVFTIGTVNAANDQRITNLEKQQNEIIKDIKQQNELINKLADTLYKLEQDVLDNN